MKRNYKFKVKSIKKMDKELCKFMKVCKDCGELKLSIEFSKKNKSNFKIRQSQCKKCLYEKSKKYKCICKQCNEEFSAPKKNSIFCSRECEGKWRSENLVGENHPSYNSIKCYCEYCGEEIYKTPYEIKTKKHLFCSRECKDKWYKENSVGENHPLYSRIYYNCEWCGKETNTNKYEYDKVKNHFCCQMCADKFHREQMKGKYNPNITQEERELSKQRLLKPEYKEWRKQVLKRDNYTCQLTGQVGGSLEVHHLDCYADFKDKRTDVNNGITLSKEVHKLFHKIYGNKHNTKEQFEEFEYRYRIGEFKEVV